MFASAKGFREPPVEWVVPTAHIANVLHAPTHRLLEAAVRPSWRSIPRVAVVEFLECHVWPVTALHCSERHEPR